MARFNYRLQPLLGVKEQIERQKEIEYGHALKRLEDERRRKRILEMDKDAQLIAFRVSLFEAVRPPDIRRYNNTIERLKNRIAEQQKRVEAAEASAEQKRLELVAAMKERKMLERIKERRYEEYIQDEKHAEYMLTDQLVSYTYAKGN